MNYAIYIFFYFFVPSNPVGMWYNKLIKCTCLACTCILVSLIKYIQGLNIFCFAVETGSSLVPPMLPVAQGKKHIPCQEIIGVVNRAAMGRARFIIYPWFIFIFLTARPWAERGSRFTLDLFFNRAAMGRARF